jgi:hypothetical protein
MELVSYTQQRILTRAKQTATKKATKEEDKN